MAKLLRLLCRYFCVEGILRRTAVAFTMRQPEVISQTLNSALRWSEEPWSATGKKLKYIVWLWRHVSKDLANSKKRQRQKSRPKADEGYQWGFTTLHLKKTNIDEEVKEQRT